MFGNLILLCLLLLYGNREGEKKKSFDFTVQQVFYMYMHMYHMYTFLICFEKQMHLDSNSRTTTRFYHVETRATALNCLYPRKIISTMGFSTKYVPRPTLLEQTAPKDSNSDSVTSTIPTDSQIKRSTTDPVRPFSTNDGFHLVTSSKTQPKITTSNLAISCW